MMTVTKEAYLPNDDKVQLKFMLDEDGEVHLTNIDISSWEDGKCWRDHTRWRKKFFSGADQDPLPYTPDQKMIDDVLFELAHDTKYRGPVKERTR